jgi:hypothetical protein
MNAVVRLQGFISKNDIGINLSVLNLPEQFIYMNGTG